MAPPELTSVMSHSGVGRLVAQLHGQTWAPDAQNPMHLLLRVLSALIRGAILF